MKKIQEKQIIDAFEALLDAESKNAETKTAHMKATTELNKCRKALSETLQNHKPVILHNGGKMYRVLCNDYDASYYELDAVIDVGKQ